ncbi:MAG: S8 family serine peptidase [Planctomycetes bacterium]|nr:S8 family serine peptidase [Planctomycetota bacterium]MCB9918681.1 S8 family serine peptidase [Planctomycetota bacterium]
MSELIRRPVMRALLAFFLGVASLASVSRAASSVVADGERIHLRLRSFDPIVDVAVAPVGFGAAADTHLWIVQAHGAPTETYRAALRAAGAEVHGYLPDNAYIVRMSSDARVRVEDIASVRAVTPYHPAYRLPPSLLAAVGARLDTSGPAAIAVPERAAYNVVVVDRQRDKPLVFEAIAGLGGRILEKREHSRLLVAELTPAQLVRVVRLDSVLWLDPVTPIGVDMDNVRIQGGANVIETKGGYTGNGVRGHVFEGIEAGHKDFNVLPTSVLGASKVSAHGHCTAGIVFGNAKSHASARGLAPDATAFYTSYDASVASRWQVAASLVGVHQVMFTTSSWGHNLTTDYDAVSAEIDELIFDHDIPWTQAFGNTSRVLARPEAWAKNVTTVGSIASQDNSSAGDDSWFGGVGAMGPASDGRIKPDLVGYDDKIHCSDLTGLAGYNPNGDSYTNFGGTSGATAIVAGHNALAIQMFTDGLFGPKRKANGTRFENRPHASTLKALQIANAAQYAFTASSTDNRREHVGWGFPDVAGMYDRRALHVVVDETDVIQQGEGMLYRVTVPQGQTDLRIVLVHTDPPANPSAALARVNDLSLHVKSPKGVEYWGNHGLESGNVSMPGGTRNTVDPVQCFFVDKPEAGTWEIEVGAYLVAEDGHVETALTDADYGLVSIGATLQSKSKVAVPVGAFTAFGSGCPSSNGCSDFLARNWTLTNGQRTTIAKAIAVLDWTTARTSICGVDFFARALATPVDVGVHVYSIDSSASTPLRAIASKTVRVSAWQQYTVEFPFVVNLDNGELFFFVIDNTDKLELPVSANGEDRYHYEYDGARWAGIGQFDTKWSYRLRGVVGASVPELDLTGDPLIGRTVSIDITGAGPSRPSVLFFGASNQTWGTIPLPFRYATPCSLLVSMDLGLPFATNVVGDAALPFALPNDQALVNLVVYVQAFFADTKNKLGVITTNGGRIKIGK